MLTVLNRKSDGKSTITSSDDPDKKEEIATPDIFSNNKWSTVYIIIQEGVIAIGKNRAAPVLVLEDPDIPDGTNAQIAYAGMNGGRVMIKFEKETFYDGRFRVENNV